MSALDVYLSPLNHSASEHRDANRRQTERVLLDELEWQYEQMNSTDPTVREKALAEIERISQQLEKIAC